MAEGGAPDPAGDGAAGGARQPPPEPGPARGSAIAGYAVATVAVVLATIALVAMIGSIGGGSDGDADQPDPSGDLTVRDAGPDVLPDGGLFKIPADVEGPEEGARAAGCELLTFRARTRDHVRPTDPPVDYPSDPPTSGRHHPVPAPDGAYSEAPDVERLVHTLEHSRVIVWFDRDLPARARASLKAYYDSDDALMVLVPDPTGMEHAVAATAWTAKPGRHGTGRMLACDEYTPEVFTALEAFKDAYRGKGLELVP